MATWYPYALRNLTTKGQIAVDGEPVLGIHFNRIMQEVTAIESALGPDPAGSMTDVKTRLAVHMNDDGTLKQELLCDDDPSGNEGGAYRFSDHQKLAVTFSTGEVGARQFLPGAFSPWEVPPVFVFCLSRSTAQGYRDSLSLQRLLDVSEVGAMVDCRNFDASTGTGSPGAQVVWWCVSRDLVSWDGDKAWALRPVRTGS